MFSTRYEGSSIYRPRYDCDFCVHWQGMTALPLSGGVDETTIRTSRLAYLGGLHPKVVKTGKKSIKMKMD